MGKILDYEEMVHHLDQLDPKVIRKMPPIGYTTHGYPLSHYIYGNGDAHVILTAGTHATELIGNCFLIHFMEQLSNGMIDLDPSKVTLHFLPILNPEGTIIVTSAIRTLIPRNTSEVTEQFLATTYYGNCKIDDTGDTSLCLDMFSRATWDVIDEKHAKLKAHLQWLDDRYHYPKGVMIAWSSNGNGVDLNSNVTPTKYLKDTLEGKKVYGEGHRRLLCLTEPGPYGCPTNGETFQLEEENRALLHFYDACIRSHHVVGSLIYHACGGQVIYLDDIGVSPWKDQLEPREIDYNQMLAKVYADETKYQVKSNTSYTTIDARIKTMLSGTLLVELTPMRGTPLGQFVNSELGLYDETIEKNTRAVTETVKKMYLHAPSRCKKDV